MELESSVLRRLKQLQMASCSRRHFGLRLPSSVYFLSSAATSASLRKMVGPMWLWYFFMQVSQPAAYRHTQHSDAQKVLIFQPCSHLFIIQYCPPKRKDARLAASSLQRSHSDGLSRKANCLPALFFSSYLRPLLLSFRALAIALLPPSLLNSCGIWLLACFSKYILFLNQQLLANESAEPDPSRGESRVAQRGAADEEIDRAAEPEQIEGGQHRQAGGGGAPARGAAPRPRPAAPQARAGVEGARGQDRRGKARRRGRAGDAQLDRDRAEVQRPAAGRNRRALLDVVLGRRARDMPVVLPGAVERLAVHLPALRAPLPPAVHRQPPQDQQALPRLHGTRRPLIPPFPYQLYYIMIAPTQKYHKLLQALAPDTQPAHSTHNAHFYFRNLRILDAELLLGEIEIAEARRQVKALEDRLGLAGQEERRKEGAEAQEELENPRNGDSSSSFLQPAAFTCSQPSCSKTFEREAGLQLHALLVHSTRAARPKYQSTFKLELKSSEQLA